MKNAKPGEPEAALKAAGIESVSRETYQRLEQYVAMLRDWQRVQNLVGPSALNEIWTRHISDSAQPLAIAPEAVRWLDLGSGAGFPGIVTAILVAERPGSLVHLVESNARKCAFLREVARSLALPVAVHHGRIDDILRGWTEAVDAISARGLASMRQLADWIEPLLSAGIPALLHKGLDFASEWAAIPHPERFVLVEHASRIRSGRHR